ncbi:MAG: plasmid replication protein RepC [Paracoccaceae bacterium]
MERLATTPFGARPVSAGHQAWMAMVDEAEAGETPMPSPDKWDLFADLRDGRAAFGVSDRDLTVLNALLSFCPGRVLDSESGLVVFPSNRKLSERAHGMAESTLRRHLAALVRAGLILRHDSPNGKRYAARGRGGDIVRAFGFDLTPLVVRAQDLTHAGEAAREAAAELRLLRDEISVRLRDVEKLAAYGELWDMLDEIAARRKAFRRKLSEGALRELLSEVLDLRRQVDIVLETRETKAVETKKVSANDACIERHYLSSKPNPTTVESCKEQDEPTAVPLDLVRDACPDIGLYGTEEIESWAELERRADLVRPMLGISPGAWREARTVMGYRPAAAVVACILQRADEIRSPGGYLRALTRKAEASVFSPIPMLVALTNRSSSESRGKVDSCQLFERETAAEKS